MVKLLSCQWGYAPIQVIIQPEHRRLEACEGWLLLNNKIKAKSFMSLSSEYDRKVLPDFVAI